jgi:hypothetical protein
MITDNGKELYLHCCKLSLDYNLISLFEFYQRMESLNSMTADVELNKWCDYHRSWLADSSVRDDGFDNCEDREWENKVDANVEEESCHSVERSDSTSDDGLMHFLTRNKGVLGEKWNFHQTDRDFFPSIPHGHLITNDKIKLDSYRGYTYDTSANNKPLKREKKSYIAQLWSDPKFQVFALKQIEFFMDEYPNFVWRVPRSRIRRLPKFKR